MSVSKAIAMLAIMTLIVIASLGNYWFTFGLWPRSWAAFSFFVVVQLLLQVALMVVKSDD